MSTGELIISALEAEAFSAEEGEEAAPFPPVNQINLAWLDIKQGTQGWQIWFMLAAQDIKLRYKRSVLGPFWITLSMAVTVYSMGYIYSQLFKTDIQQYYPFLVTGMLGWTLISTILLDFSDGFLSSHGLIKQIKLPYSLHIHRIAARNLLIFMHNVVVMLPIYIIFHKDVPINWCTLFLIPSFAIIYLNSFLYGMVIAMICARYRDIAPIIKSAMQVIFFITPVMWQPQGLAGNQHFIVDLNPIYPFLELIRQPLLGNLPTLKNLIVVLIVTCVGFLMSFRLLTRYRSRIIFWL